MSPRHSILPPQPFTRRTSSKLCLMKLQKPGSLPSSRATPDASESDDIAAVLKCLLELGMHCEARPLQPAKAVSRRVARRTN